LHDTLRENINRQQKNSQIWLHILQQQESCHIYRNQYTFKREVEQFGWCVGLVQKYITMCKPQVKAETAKKLGLEFISITEEGIDDIEIPDEYLKLTIQCILIPINMTVFLLLQYVQPNLTVLLLSIDFFTQCIANPTQESDSNDNLGKKWDAFYNLKDTQTDVSYINQLPTNPPKRIC
jgi:hypothetical protein